MSESQYFPLPDSKDPFDKVIFLDIDGVLNDGHHDATKPIIDSKMVSFLAHIVCETNARIVLSSSWKHAWCQFVANGYVPTSRYDSDLVALKENLDDYGLAIDGITPDSDLVFAAPPGVMVMLAKTTEFGISVLDMLRKYFRNISFVTLPELYANSTNTVFMAARTVGGSPVAQLGYSDPQAGPEGFQL